ncbi:protein-methionine-sulfoxide reductase catalytic subunit MsrP [Alloacidobacterium sp.]|uniref:protein-methionine-sulfoxide reductase catalytic subunit MsrP n=1 Tax=Alloacidobacterium sp. TaxID=2951999 RepID=UPI002D4871C0|nr:protein-methionine-sulfoxide reductase catalytic subunit MsrP [Alloacidobacterium sp.]HYK34771.1 protein-methionine-sulfoxide reductase catalytic subunit MsrP [Alloacidobacterium sp.]
MLIRKPSDIPSSEITSKSAYLNRRTFMAAAGAAGLAAFAGNRISRIIDPKTGVEAGTKLDTIKSPLSTTGEDLTPYQYITNYNNFYEFGVEKGDPAKYAGRMQTRPWTVMVEGLVAKPKTFDIDTLLKLRPQEERVYRMRCVEAWSMVIPWVGYSLSEFIKECEPLGKAKFVQFLTLENRKEMPGLSQSSLNWPYSEGLRMDEAMHPLTLLCFGLYGETLPNQDGAPVRIVVPWKYGFKSAKSIVKVRFVEKQPHTAWNDQSPEEYGFYSNVNPNVDHPRWSQKTERRIGEPVFKQRRPTLMFNGYGDQVASLYNGMDLRRYY